MLKRLCNACYSTVYSQDPFSPSSLTATTGVVSAPLWNSEKSKFAGMLTVLDIIHLIQYYYDTANYEAAAADVETFRLESLRGTYAVFYWIRRD